MKQKKVIRITLRLTQEQYKSISEKADAAQMTIVKGGKLRKLRLPHAQNGERRDDQHAPDAPGLRQRAGDGDGRQRFSGADATSPSGALPRSCAGWEKRASPPPAQGRTGRRQIGRLLSGAGTARPGLAWAERAAYQAASWLSTS